MGLKDKLKKLWCFIEKPSRNIKLVDKCLIIFMMLIMGQTAFTLFVNEVGASETHLIDVVVRTSAAGIFGYFLSANFIKDSSKKEENTTLQNPIIGGGGEDMEDMAVGHPYDMCDLPAKKHTQNEQQIIIATSIGIASFLIMIIARNFFELTPASNGTISQLRDFFSGSVGFLLGTPANGDNN